MEKLIFIGKASKAESNQIASYVLCQNVKESISLLAFPILFYRFFLGDEKII
jgi:hypothetical protein